MPVKPEWLGYRTVKKNCDDMLSRFHLIPERYGRTDRQTDGRTDRRTDLLYQYRASVCWRAIKMCHLDLYIFWKTGTVNSMLQWCGMVLLDLFLSAWLYFSKRGAYWDRLCHDVVLMQWKTAAPLRCNTVHHKHVTNTSEKEGGIIPPVLKVGGTDPPYPPRLRRLWF